MGADVINFMTYLVERCGFGPVLRCARIHLKQAGSANTAVVDLTGLFALVALGREEKFVRLNIVKNMISHNASLLTVKETI